MSSSREQAAHALAKSLDVPFAHARNVIDALSLGDDGDDEYWAAAVERISLRHEIALLEATRAVSDDDLRECAQDENPDGALKKLIRKDAEADTAPSLTPEQRSLRARIAGLTFAATNDVAEHMKAAQAASPGQLSYWERQVDPEGQLDERERHRRADCARRAHMTKLALASSRARRTKRKDRA